MTSEQSNKSARQILIEQVIDRFCRVAEEEELEKEMRQEGIDALKIAANKYAYKKKYYNMMTDQVVIIPTITKLLVQSEIYEEAEKYYYDPEDEFPLKYIAALKDIAIAAGGAPSDDDEQMESMGMDIADLENDEVFTKVTSDIDLEALVCPQQPKPKQPLVPRTRTRDEEEEEEEETQQQESDSAALPPPPPPPTDSSDTSSITTSTRRSKFIEMELLAFIKKAEDEELGKEMRDEGIKALLIAANKLAYTKKSINMRTDTFVAFPSVKKCLASADNAIYEEAEKHYYDPEDEFPLKYIAALRDIALAAGGAPTVVDDEMAQMNEPIQNENDEMLFPDNFINLETLFIPPPPIEEKKSKRQQLIHTEIAAFVKKAEDEELGKEMREEGVQALLLAADKIAYKKKTLDMKTDKFVAIPSIVQCLASSEIYEEAEKYYFDPGDEYPLKYIAALRGIAMSAGGMPEYGEDDNDFQQNMCDDIDDSDDEIFTTITPNLGEPPKPKPLSKRQLRIEQEIDEYVQRAEQEELEKEMREEGVKALKIAAKKFAYRKKYYDMANDKFIVFPSVTKLLTQTEVYEEAEKYYYDPGDDYPIKYIAALRAVAFDAGYKNGALAQEEDIIETMADDAASDDEALG